MKPKNTSYLLIVILLVASFSLLTGDTSIALLIDPSNPDSNKVKIFQKTYMGMLDGDRGYGTFGPKTTAKWKEVVYNNYGSVSFKEPENLAEWGKITYFERPVPWVNKNQGQMVPMISNYIFMFLDADTIVSSLYFSALYSGQTLQPRGKPMSIF